MIRGFSLTVAAALVASLISTHPLDASHGHGGGGGHGGGHSGGHGGGHMGGGHSGHVGGHSGHFGGGHVGHSGGVQHHMGGAQHHVGGTQHHMGGVQHHMGGVQNHIGNSQHSVQHHSNLGSVHQQHLGNSVNHQHLGNVGANQHLGHQNHLGAHNNLGSQHLQTHAPFYQNHAHNHGAGSNVNGNGLHHGVNSANFSNHHGSQFLSQHSGAGLHHNGIHNNGIGHNHGLGNQSNHHLSNNFLSHHHVANVSSVTAAHHGNFHNGHGGLTHNHHAFNNGFNGNHHNHNHPYLNSGGYYRHHGYGYGTNYWRYPNYRYGYGVGLGFGLGYGLGLGGLGYYGGYGLGSYGLGYGYGGYGGYGYGFGGYGYGLNGYGYGLNGYNYLSSYGYPGWGCIGYMPNCAYQSYGYGYSNGLSPYGTYASYGGNSGLMNSGLAYAQLPQMSTFGNAIVTDAAPAVVPSTIAANQVLDTTSGATSGLPTAEQFAQIGETAFKSRDYKGAVRAWRHGLVDDPQNSVLVLMLSQALFATEQFTESAGAVQAAMQTLPEDKWGIVIKNFRDLYGKGEDYTVQVRALEKAAREKPDEPSLRFLLGYHYGFLGYPVEAVKQLEKCVSLAPRDEVAQRVLRLFDDKSPKKNDPPTPGQPPESSLQTIPTPLDFIPPPPLNPEPTSAALKTAASEPLSATKPANESP